MPELTREEKLKLIEKLPQQLQDFLYSEDTGAFLLYLGQKYNLPDEKVGLLSKLLADVVLRITPITSLAQEIGSKIISDPQAAMNLAQELNNELLAPALAPAPSAPTAPMTAPTAPVPLPAKPIAPAAPPADRYRESVTAGPEVVDLRKAPPAAMSPSTPLRTSKVEPPPPVFTPKPVVPQIKPAVPQAPTVPVPEVAPAFGAKEQSPVQQKAIPAPGRPTVPLIEAEPHLPAKISPEISAGKITPPEPKPQYIMRPSGLPPTDLPRNILDLRQDKGEF